MINDVNKIVNKLMIFCGKYAIDLDLEQLQKDLKNFTPETLWIFAELITSDFYYLCSPHNNDVINWQLFKRIEDLHAKMSLMSYKDIFDLNKCNNLSEFFVCDKLNKREIIRSFREKLSIATNSKLLYANDYFEWDKLAKLNDSETHAEINTYIMLAAFLSLVIITSSNNNYLSMLNDVLIESNILICDMVMKADSLVIGFVQKKSITTKIDHNDQMYNFLSPLVLDYIDAKKKDGKQITRLSLKDPDINTLMEQWYLFCKKNEIKSKFNSKLIGVEDSFENWKTYASRKVKGDHLNYLVHIFFGYGESCGKI